MDSGSSAYKWQQLSDYDGDALLLSIGPALYFSLIDWDNWNLILDTGLQYVLVDSSVTVFNTEENVPAETQGEQDVDIDNVVLWNIGLEYEYMLSENLYVQANGGYQVDVLEGDTEYAGRSVRDVSFSGFYARLGAKFLF